MSDPNIEARRSKSFDYAQESTKQLITLATGVTTITIAFRKDLAVGVPCDAQTALLVGWLLFGLSVLAGVATLLNLTGRVGAMPDSEDKGIYATAIRAASLAQVCSFVLALAAVIYFGARSL